MPGWRIGTSSSDSPSPRREPGFVLARTKIQSATWASDVQTFCPLIIHSPPSSRPAVVTDARSDPAPGSEKPWHHSSRTAAIGGRKRRRCPGVPYSTSVGPSSCSPTWLTRAGAPARAYSSWKIICCPSVAPRPPWAAGQFRAVHPAAARCRSQASRRANASCSRPGPPAPRRLANGPDRLRSSHPRIQARNSCSPILAMAGHRRPGAPAASPSSSTAKDSSRPDPSRTTPRRDPHSAAPPPPRPRPPPDLNAWEEWKAPPFPDCGNCVF